ADLPREVQASVFGRMQAEREREAKRYRSEGEEEAAKLRAETEKQRTIILASAEQQAHRLRGEADAALRRFTLKLMARTQSSTALCAACRPMKHSLANAAPCSSPPIPRSSATWEAHSRPQLTVTKSSQQSE